MAALVLNGDSSGTITLAAPAAAGATTLTLPATSGTVALTSDIPASIGVGQTWQNVTASRVVGTTYTNSSGKPIFISVRLEQDDGTITLTVDGLMIGRSGYTAGPVYYTLTGIIPVGSTYVVGTTGGTFLWYELR